MNKRALITLVAFALGGCASTAPYGNFVPPPVTVDQHKLAGEASKQLAALWPPAKTRLELQQATPDEFGTALVADLRTAGYAVLEYAASKASSAATTADKPVEAPVIEATPSTAVLALRYVLDHDAGLYRLTLLVGDQSITRPYMEHNGALVPVGYWVRKE